MNLFLDRSIATNYRSTSQKIRIMSENWVGHSISCPSCGNSLDNFNNNAPVADFLCSICHEEFELKSKMNSFGKKINDGAYQTMITRITSPHSPHLFLLNYSKEDYSVLNFCVVPSHFFTPTIIEKRKPLSTTARRAGWTGCNILYSEIPNSGKIYYIKNTKVFTKKVVQNSWQKTNFLRDVTNQESKGWILDIMKCVESLNRNEFALNDIYKYEEFLRLKHPNNNFIKDKIRQQLQKLRDKGYLEFKGKGKYKVI